MKKVLLLLALIMPLTLSAQGIFSNLYEGMSKDDVKAELERLEKEDKFKPGAAYKGGVIKECMFTSPALKGECNVTVMFRYKKKQLVSIELTVYAGSLPLKGGYSKKKATILQEKASRQLKDHGYEFDLSIQQVTAGGSNYAFIPKGYLVLQEKSDI